MSTIIAGKDNVSLPRQPTRYVASDSSVNGNVSDHGDINGDFADRDYGNDTVTGEGNVNRCR